MCGNKTSLYFCLNTKDTLLLLTAHLNLNKKKTINWLLERNNRLNALPCTVLCVYWEPNLSAEVIYLKDLQLIASSEKQLDKTCSNTRSVHYGLWNVFNNIKEPEHMAWGNNVDNYCKVRRCTEKTTGGSDPLNDIVLASILGKTSKIWHEMLSKILKMQDGTILQQITNLRWMMSETA